MTLGGGGNQSLALTRDQNFEKQSSDNSVEEIGEDIPVPDGLRKETTFIWARLFTGMDGITGIDYRNGLLYVAFSAFNAFYMHRSHRA